MLDPYRTPRKPLEAILVRPDAPFDRLLELLLELLQDPAPGEVALGLFPRHPLLEFGPPRLQLLDDAPPLFGVLYRGRRVEGPLEGLYAPLYAPHRRPPLFCACASRASRRSISSVCSLTFSSTETARR